MGPSFYVVIRATRTSSRLWGADSSTFISQLFLDPEYCSGPGYRTRHLPLCSESCRGKRGMFSELCKRTYKWTLPWQCTTHLKVTAPSFPGFSHFLRSWGKRGNPVYEVGETGVRRFTDLSWTEWLIIFNGFNPDFSTFFNHYFLNHSTFIDKPFLTLSTCI